MLLLFHFHPAAAVFAGPSDTLQGIKISHLEQCLEWRDASPHQTMTYASSPRLYDILCSLLGLLRMILTL